MILKLHLDTGELYQVPIKRAHVRDGTLLYQPTVPLNTVSGGVIVDLSRTKLIEFEDSGVSDS